MRGYLRRLLTRRRSLPRPVWWLFDEEAHIAVRDLTADERAEPLRDEAPREERWIARRRGFLITSTSARRSQR
jgi:hypothetical protein